MKELKIVGWSASDLFREAINVVNGEKKRNAYSS